MLEVSEKHPYWTKSGLHSMQLCKRMVKDGNMIPVMKKKDTAQAIINTIDAVKNLEDGEQTQFDLFGNAIERNLETEELDEEDFEADFLSAHQEEELIEKGLFTLEKLVDPSLIVEIKERM